MMFARLLEGLTVAALFTRIIVADIVVADVGLRMLRDEAQHQDKMREALALVVAVFVVGAFRCRRAVRLVLPELPCAAASVGNSVGVLV